MSVVELTKITAPCPPPPQLEILAPTTHTHTTHTHTVQTANIYRHIRNTCSWEADSQQAGTSSTKLLNTPIILGGRNVTVQIAEPFFHHKPKYHRGPAPHSEQWVFDLVDTSCSPSLGHMELLPRQDAQTSLPIIQAHTHPGTIIYSDQWQDNAVGHLPTPATRRRTTVLTLWILQLVLPYRTSRATGTGSSATSRPWWVWAQHNSPVTWTSSCGPSNGGETRKKHISTWWQTSLHSILYNLRVPSLSRTFLLKFLPF